MIEEEIERNPDYGVNRLAKKKTEPAEKKRKPPKNTDHNLLNYVQIRKRAVKSVFGNTYSEFKKKYGDKIAESFLKAHLEDTEQWAEKQPVNNRVKWLHRVTPTPVTTNYIEILNASPNVLNVIKKCRNPYAVVRLLKDYRGTLEGKNKLENTPQTILDVIHQLGNNSKEHKKIAQILEEGTEIHTQHRIPEAIGLLAYLVFDEEKASLEQAVQLIRLSKKADTPIQTARSRAHLQGIVPTLQWLKARST